MLYFLLIVIVVFQAVLAYLIFTFKKDIKPPAQDFEKIASEISKSGDRMQKFVGDEMQRNRTELSEGQKVAREEMAKQIRSLTESTEGRLDKVKVAIEEKLNAIQTGNEKKLEQMRHTVDEKLHATLEKRLGESFKLVSERLELVHKGLGEMQSIATGVGDLKKVLTNVKTRGILGEVQLSNLLEEMLTPEQYERNVKIKKRSDERVEFAIKFPGPSKEIKHILIPIDAKFPVEDYQRLVDAESKGDLDAIVQAGKALENRVKTQAKDIRDKYINPPDTTDFAILFLPFESLYAEVLKRPGFFEQIQQQYRVIITGPTTFQAILNGLRMGFQTLAIQKRSSEVWALLGAIKNEFGKFGQMLEKTQKKLQEASNTIEEAATKTRNIQGKLNKVQELPMGMKENLKLLESEKQSI